ncbi:MAG: DUF2723 domain-containing protein [Thermodesulfovibrio sp.]|nr:DUF2723 domain-containing protein [Thermodesulfovibrio sp.]
MHRGSYIVFALFLILYIFSLNPVFPTGDAGGLVVASHMLGLAHPPGYPLFSELGKLFSFIPLGNIGIRVGFLPCVFSVLTLFMVYLITMKIQRFYLKESSPFLNLVIPLIAVFSFGLSYSFYFQTTMTKFYPINAFIVLLLFYLVLLVFEKGFDRRIMFLSSFLLGLASGLHHTGLFMIIPLFIFGLYYRRDFFKNLPFAAIFFLLGFLINLHLYVRSIRDSFSAAHKAGDLMGFVNMLLRRFYGESSSIDTVSVAFYEPSGYINAINNFLYMIDANFGYASLLFVIVAFIFLFRMSKKLFVFISVSFLLYSFALAKMTMSGTVKNVSSMYVVGNQYFIPAYSIYAILMAVGVGVITKIFSKFNYRLLQKVIPIFFIALPIIFLPMRFNQTMQINNWVPYYHGKDLLSILPVSSTVSTYGDNHTFELWYLKIVGRYRDDVCHITSYYYNDTSWRMEGCKPKEIYKNLHPEFFSGDLEGLMLKKRFYSTVALSEEHPFYKFIDYKPYTFIFAYLPKGKVSLEDEEFLKELNLNSERFLTPKVCLIHRTDDPFTFEMCRFFSNSYLVLSHHVKPKKTLEKILVDASISYGRFLAPFRLNIELGKENIDYITLYQTIRAYNDYKRCYLLD